MANRNKAVAYAAGEFKAKYDFLPTVDDIIDATKLARNQIYATDAYKEGKIAKSSAKVTAEMIGGSVKRSEYYHKKSEEHGRAKKQSNAEQDELKALVAEQQNDAKSDRVL